MATGGSGSRRSPQVAAVEAATAAAGTAAAAAAALGAALSGGLEGVGKLPVSSSLRLSSPLPAPASPGRSTEQVVAAQSGSLEALQDRGEDSAQLRDCAREAGARVGGVPPGPAPGARPPANRGRTQTRSGWAPTLPLPGNVTLVMEPLGARSSPSLVAVQNTKLPFSFPRTLIALTHASGTFRRWCCSLLVCVESSGARQGRAGGWETPRLWIRGRERRRKEGAGGEGQVETYL